MNNLVKMILGKYDTFILYIKISFRLFFQPCVTLGSSADFVVTAREAGREGRDLAVAMARPRDREEAGGVLNPKGEPDRES